MRNVEIVDVSMAYLNVLFDKYNRRRLPKEKLKRFQDTLFRWSMVSVERMEREYYEKGESNV